jgi:hypothetical protein
MSMHRIRNDNLYALYTTARAVTRTIPACAGDQCAAAVDGDRTITIAPVGVRSGICPLPPARPNARAPHARTAARSNGRQDVGPTDLI